MPLTVKDFLLGLPFNSSYLGKQQKSQMFSSLNRTFDIIFGGVSYFSKINTFRNHLVIIGY